MAEGDLRISDLTTAGSLDGTELVPIVKSGVTENVPSQAIADLGGGGSISDEDQTITTPTRVVKLNGSLASDVLKIKNAANLDVATFSGDRSTRLENSVSIGGGIISSTAMAVYPIGKSYGYYVQGSGSVADFMSSNPVASGFRAKPAASGTTGFFADIIGTGSTKYGYRSYMQVSDSSSNQIGFDVSAPVSGSYLPNNTTGFKFNYSNSGTETIGLDVSVTNSTTNTAIHVRNGNVIIENIPTASAGLATGTLWNDSGVLKIA